MRPLAGAFTTLGIAGLLLAALPFLPMTGGPATALAPAPSADRGAIHETMNPEAMLTAGPEMNAGAAATQAPTGADAKSTDIPGGIESLATIDIAAGSEDGESVVAQSAAPAVSLPLILLSVTFLALGIGLLLLRASGIRRR
ncbi:MAG: hypothetical protein HW391_1148 [Chloroflexi bacterium]|nr:hypothetical protein [Chloroflexota bacterium]